jgi:hypothetical protein
MDELLPEEIRSVRAGGCDVAHELDARLTGGATR